MFKGAIELETTPYVSAIQLRNNTVCFGHRLNLNKRWNFRVLFRMILVNVIVYFSQISDFGVSTANLNTTDISRRPYKVNFGPLRSHVKSHHFPERYTWGDNIFTFFIQISWNNWQETTWATFLDNDSTLLLLFKRN